MKPTLPTGRRLTKVLHGLLLAMCADVLTQIRANPRADVRLERWARVFVDKTLPLYVMYYLRGLKEELVVLERKTKNAKVRKAWAAVWSSRADTGERLQVTKGLQAIVEKIASLNTVKTSLAYSILYISYSNRWQI